MELRDYVAVLRKYWVSIVGVTLLGLATSAVITLVTPPSYTARTAVFISVRGGDTAGELLEGANYATNQVRSYAQVATTPTVLQPVIVTPSYDDPVASAPPAQRRPSPETGEPGQPKKAARPPRDRNRNPFEAYGERASSRPYALRLPDAVDLALRQLAAEERTQPLRIVDRAIHDLLKRLGRLPPVDEP